MGAKFLGDIYPQCVIDSFAHAATRGRDSWSVTDQHCGPCDFGAAARRVDGDGQNKLLQINGSKNNSTRIISRLNLIQSLYIQQMGFMIG